MWAKLLLSTGRVSVRMKSEYVCPGEWPLSPMARTQRERSLNTRKSEHRENQLITLCSMKCECFHDFVCLIWHLNGPLLGITLRKRHESCRWSLSLFSVTCHIFFTCFGIFGTFFCANAHKMRERRLSCTGKRAWHRNYKRAIIFTTVSSATDKKKLKGNENVTAFYSGHFSFLVQKWMWTCVGLRTCKAHQNLE